MSPRRKSADRIAMEKALGWVSPYGGRRNESGEAQLSGWVAKYDSMCKRCHEPILAGQSRVIRHGDGVMHVTCASGWDE